MVQSGTLEIQTAVYSSVRDEYTSASEGVGITDRSHLGRLRVSGADALDLLNRLSTNNLDDLAIGDVQGTVLTTNKGRIIDLLYVLRQDDHLLVLTGPETCQRVAEWIDFYTFIEDVVVEDVTEETAMLSVVGRAATSSLPQLADMPLYGSAQITIDGVDVLALRTDFTGVDGYDLIGPAEQAPALWDALTATGAAPVGSQALELVRISNGIAGNGGELEEDYNPIEAGLMDFISFNKGCYIGQEVVARLNTYDKVQKHLVRLSWDGDDAPELPADLLHDGRKVGTLTTAVKTIDGDKFIGLGFVRKAHVEEGVRLLTEDDVEVVVEETAQTEQE